jgi:hypothetical protein
VADKGGKSHGKGVDAKNGYAAEPKKNRLQKQRDEQRREYGPP